MEREFVNLNGIRKRAILNRFKEVKHVICTVIEEISEEEKLSLDRDKHYTTKGNILIQKNNILLYGEVNIEKDSALIDSKIDMNDERHVVYSDFDYDKGGFFKDEENRTKEYETVNPQLWFKFNHCLIGKPKRIIVYNINKSYLND